MSKTSEHLVALEQDPFWQATVEREGELIVFMRGHKGAPYENRYYTMRGGLAGYPRLGSWIREQSESGILKLLRGSIPNDDNEVPER